MSLDLGAIKARCEEATKGPWKCGRIRWTEADGTYKTAGPAVIPGWDGAEATQDAEFIAHAREDVPALVAEVERLTRELGEARARLVVDDAMVERAAVGICGKPWDHDGYCDYCDRCHREDARAALEAALGGTR